MNLLNHNMKPFPFTLLLKCSFRLIIASLISRMLFSSRYPNFNFKQYLDVGICNILGILLDIHVVNNFSIFSKAETVHNHQIFGAVRRM